MTPKASGPKASGKTRGRKAPALLFPDPGPNPFSFEDAQRLYKPTHDNPVNDWCIRQELNMAVHFNDAHARRALVDRVCTALMSGIEIHDEYRRWLVWVLEFLSEGERDRIPHLASGPPLRKFLMSKRAKEIVNIALQNPDFGPGQVIAEAMKTLNLSYSTARNAYYGYWGRLFRSRAASLSKLPGPE